MNWYFNDWYFYDNKLFMIHSLTGIFGSYDVDSNRIEFVNDIDCSSLSDFGSVEKAVIKNSIAYIFSERGNRTLKLDMKNKMISNVDIDAHQQDWGNYACITISDEAVFVFLRNKPELIVINNAFKDNVEIENQLLPVAPSIGMAVNNDVWLFSENDCCLMHYDLKDGNCNIVKLEGNIDGVKNLTIDGEKIYLITNGGEVMSYDSSSNVVSEFMTIPCCGIYKMVPTDTSFVFLPEDGKDIYVYDKKDRTLNKYDGYPSDFSYGAPDGWSRFMGWEEVGTWYYFAMRSANFILKVNTNDGMIEWLNPILPSESENIRYFEKKNGLVNETRDVTLNGFIKAL